MIVCCGEALVDMVPDGGRADAFLARPGGCPYNTAIAAARLGARVAFLGRLGRDFLGAGLHERLATNGVDVSRVARSDQATTLAFVTRDEKGNAQYAFYSEAAADRSLSPGDLPDSLGPEASFLVLGSISMVQEPLATTVEGLALREKDRVLVSFDPNIRPGLIKDRHSYLARFETWARASAIVKISSEDLEWLYPGLPAEACAKGLMALGPSLVIATLGEEGALAITARQKVASPAFRVSVADTIGAGDTFHAAFLSRLDALGIRSRKGLEGLGHDILVDCLAYANAAAAVNCTRHGAEPPTDEEVRSFLAVQASKEGL